MACELFDGCFDDPVVHLNALNQTYYSSDAGYAPGDPFAIPNLFEGIFGNLGHYLYIILMIGVSLIVGIFIISCVLSCLTRKTL